MIPGPTALPDAIRTLARLAIAVAILVLSMAAAVAVYLAVWWMDYPPARVFTFAAGVMFFGCASAIVAGATEA